MLLSRIDLRRLPEIELPLICALPSFSQAVISTFWTCQQDVGAGIAPGIAGANIGAVMPGIREVGIVSLHGQLPMIEGELHLGSSLSGSERCSTRATKLISKIL